MGWQRLSGGLWVPGLPTMLVATATGFMSGLVIDATGEKVAMCGRVWHPGYGSKDITRVGFRFGAVTKAGGSGLTISLEDVSLTAGPPMQPDGVQDQSVAIANGDAGFTSNVWYRTDPLSAVRSVNVGDLLAVVIEYDVGGRLGADSVVISGVSPGVSLLQSGCSLYTASWAAISALPDVLLEFSDGTYGTLAGGFPCSAISYATIKATTNPDEVGLVFTVPFPCKVDGAWDILYTAASTSEFSVVLYQDNTPLVTIPVDANSLMVMSSTRVLFVPFPAEQTLAPGTTYRLSVLGTGAANVYPYYFDVADAAHFQAHEGMANWAYTSRTDGGEWAAPTMTRRLFAGLRVSSCPEGLGGSVWGTIR